MLVCVQLCRAAGGCGGLLCQYSIHGRVLGHVYSQNVFCGLDVEPKPNNGQRRACKKERKRKGLISRPTCTPRRKLRCPSSQPQPVSIPNTDANRESAQCSVWARPHNGGKPLAEDSGHRQRIGNNRWVRNRTPRVQRGCNREIIRHISVSAFESTFGTASSGAHTRIVVVLRHCHQLEGNFERQVGFNALSARETEAFG